MSSAVASEAMWLDLLPHEVCHQVALYVTCGRQNADALLLAEMSATLRHAVWKSLPHPISIPLSLSRGEDCVNDPRELLEWEGEKALRWAEAFKEYEVKVYSDEFTEWTIKLLTRKGTTHCKIGPGLYLFLSHSDVKFLSLRIGRSTRIKGMFDVLKTLDLHELTLEGSLCDEQRRDLLRESNQLVSCCPNLQLISFKNVTFQELERNDERYWETLAALPECAEIFLLGCRPPEHVVRNLNRLRAVHAHEMDSSVCLGSMVTFTKHGLGFLHETVTGQEIRNLAQCRKLRSIDLGVHVTNADELANLVGVLPNLSSLSVAWDAEPRRRSRKEMKLKRGAMPAIVKAGRGRLTDLSVNCFQGISISDWVHVLEIMGPRLKQLTVEGFITRVLVDSVSQLTDEHQTVIEDATIEMLRGVLKHSPNIRTLSLQQYMPTRYSDEVVYWMISLMTRRPLLDKEKLWRSMMRQFGNEV